MYVVKNKNGYFGHAVFMQFMVGQINDSSIKEAVELRSNSPALNGDDAEKYAHGFHNKAEANAFAKKIDGVVSYSDLQVKMFNIRVAQKYPLLVARIIKEIQGNVPLLDFSSTDHIALYLVLFGRLKTYNDLLLGVAKIDL